MKQEPIIVLSGKTEPYTYQTLNVAINYAVKIHSGKFGKGLIPCIVHPLEVMNNLGFMRADMTLMAAGVLHDIVENKILTLEDITEKFGQDIADLVDFLAEQDQSFPWRENKEILLKYLEKASQRKQMLVLAYELSNIEAMVRDFEKLGDFYWKIYQDDREEKEWYYRAVVKALSKLEEDYDVKYYYHRFISAVDYVFNSGNSANSVKNYWE